MVRKAVVAGQFYASSKEELTSEIEKALKGAPDPAQNSDGIISPHAGIMFSGRCQAAAYKALKKARTCIVLGFSHRGLGRHRLNISSEDWETPLGVVRTDMGLAETLSRLNGAGFDDACHQNEHSIEVQLPFLQYLGKGERIVACSVHGREFGMLAQEAAKLICEASVVASSDFTHYGPGFGYTPFTDNVRENLRKLDMGAVERILALDLPGFADYLLKTEATICGSPAISLLLEIMKVSGNMGELLMYYTSGDVTGDFSHCVSYAAIGFKRRNQAEQRT